MKTLNFIKLFTWLILVVFIHSGTLLSNSSDDFHIRTGVWGNPPKQYKFNNVAENAGYLTAFPTEKMKQEIPNEKLQNWDITYQIFTSIEDAEFAMVEQLDMSNLFVYNIIDVPLPQGKLGDNCWYQLSAGVVKFLRNNVLVSISPESDVPSDNLNAEWLARQIDNLLLQCDKVDDANLIPAPEFHSAEIVSALPKDWQGSAKIQVNATSQHSSKLFFRKYATGFALVSETGLLKITFNKNTDSTENSNMAKVKIWIWDENFVTTSAEIEIPF